MKRQTIPTNAMSGTNMLLTHQPGFQAFTLDLEIQLGVAQSRADGSGRRAGTGRERSLRCVPMSCGVVYSLYVVYRLRTLHLIDYVATLLVMTGLE